MSQNSIKNNNTIETSLNLSVKLQRFINSKKNISSNLNTKNNTQNSVNTKPNTYNNNQINQNKMISNLSNDYPINSYITNQNQKTVIRSETIKPTTYESTKLNSNIKVPNQHPLYSSKPQSPMTPNYNQGNLSNNSTKKSYTNSQCNNVNLTNLDVMASEVPYIDSKPPIMHSSNSKRTNPINLNLDYFTANKNMRYNTSNLSNNYSSGKKDEQSFNISPIKIRAGSNRDFMAVNESMFKKELNLNNNNIYVGNNNYNNFDYTNPLDQLEEVEKYNMDDGNNPIHEIESPKSRMEVINERDREDNDRNSVNYKKTKMFENV